MNPVNLFEEPKPVRERNAAPCLNPQLAGKLLSLQRMDLKSHLPALLFEGQLKKATSKLLSRQPIRLYHSVILLPIYF
jgi:hypothetical protein